VGPVRARAWAFPGRQSSRAAGVPRSFPIDYCAPAERYFRQRGGSVVRFVAFSPSAMRLRKDGAPGLGEFSPELQPAQPNALSFVSGPICSLHPTAFMRTYPDLQAKFKECLVLVIDN